MSHLVPVEPDVVYVQGDKYGSRPISELDVNVWEVRITPGTPASTVPLLPASQAVARMPVHGLLQHAGCWGSLMRPCNRMVVLLSQAQHLIGRA